MPFDDVHRLDNTLGNKTRSIYFRLVRSTDKHTIWSNRYLKGTCFFIYEDLPKSYVKAKSQPRPVMTAAKLCGKKASFNGDKLKVDGHSYGVYDIPNLPSHLNPEKACTKSTNGVMLFLGKHSPLPNFHEYSLTIDGFQYTGVEQRYQQKKAECSKKEKLEQQFISPTYPVRQKYLGNKVKVDDETWKTAGLVEMCNAVKAKFVQNDKLKEYLLAIEASTDSF